MSEAIVTRDTRCGGRGKLWPIFQRSDWLNSMRLTIARRMRVSIWPRRHHTADADRSALSVHANAIVENGISEIIQLELYQPSFLANAEHRPCWS
jgi:hypothetical protein